MAGICKSKVRYTGKGSNGTALVFSFVIMGALFLIGFYFLSFTLTSSKIAKSQTQGVQAYYLAEAGINEAIWKLKYDEYGTTTDGDVPWADCFATSTAECGNCRGWSATFSTTSEELIPNSQIIVSIQNSTSTCAKGDITATSTITLPGGRTVQRVVKTTAYKSQASPTAGAAVFSGGASQNIDIDFSKVRVWGNLFSNHNLNIKLLSTVEVYATSTGKGKILAVGNYDDSGSNVTSNAKCAKNICHTTSTCECTDTDVFQEACSAEATNCPPLELSTPVVDFDSAATTSFKERASSTEAAGRCQNFCNGDTCYCDGGSPCAGNNKCVLDDEELEDLLWAAGQGGTLTLGTSTAPTITYVTGSIDLKGGRHLVVNGALVADDTINIGEVYKWTRGGQKDEGFSQLTINRPTATTTSGLLTKDKINFGLYSSFSTTTIVGVVYANDAISFVSMPKKFEVIGGIVGRKLNFVSVLQWFNFILNDEIVRYGLGYKIDDKAVMPIYSPIITVEHWEETY